MSRLWIDVEDLFAHAGAFRRPSGIQRVTFELCRALAEANDAGFLRHAGRRGFRVTSWREIEALFQTLATAPPDTAPPRFWEAQLGAIRTLSQLPASLLPPKASGPAAPFAAGDTLLVAGAGWDDPTHAARVSTTCRSFGLRLAVLLHDLIPLRRPEWCDPQTVLRFTRWSDHLLAAADIRLANSQATARDIRARCTARGLPERPLHVLRFGDGFAPQPGATPGIEGRYALFVSTLELRKNHALLIEAWRTLLAEQGPQAVPRLVLVGREGPLVADLMASLRASRFLDGHVLWRQHATDADLTALYRGCDFTLFPSLYEGWGLPVAESLCFGKPCLAASATSLPEVGGELVRYFDPMDLSDAVRVIGDVMRAPAQLAVRSLQIRQNFRPTPWRDTAAQLCATLGS